jgi:phosphohistidine phosphatase SixA
MALALLLAGCATGNRADLHGAAAVPADRPFVDARAIIIIRHADIDPVQKAAMGNATPLLAAGEARAKELLPAMKDAGISRIVTSVAVRTQATAGPLARELKIVPENPFGHGAEGGAATAVAGTEAQAVYRYLAQTAKPGQAILLVHHHSVIPGLMAEFGFAGETPIVDASEFDRVYVILPDRETRTYRVLRLRYNGVWGK